jgi:predicted Zn-dependent protease
MEDKERIHAEIEARLNRFSKNIDELTAKAKTKEKELPAAHKPAIEAVKAKKKVADKKFEELKRTDKNAPHWHTVKAEVDQYVGDVDDSLREALAYF